MTLRGAVAPLDADDPALGLVSILDETGALVSPSLLPALSHEELVRIYRGMVTIRLMDERLLALQRQGRIGFYGEAKGQEAAVIGAAAALGTDDWIVPALREAGAAIYRGLSLSEYVAQIFGNDHDVAKGRQLPCHPGTRKARYVTMSSCIASQLPHAVGMAWAAKIKKDPVVVLGCMGDGATSEPDFHYALNFAGVQQLPVVLFCQNNQWAISTPCTVQSASQTFAQKAIAYGMPGVRVDGNDVLAVYRVVKEAVDRARAGQGPTLVEALTYRVSAHSSSDDPSRYRDETVTERWRQKDPIARMATYLRARGILTDAIDASMKDALESELKRVVAEQEAAPMPALRTLVEDVFAEVPAFLEEQLSEIADLPRQKLGGVHA